jgi:F-type H+-transporting ATPase subunit delta
MPLIDAQPDALSAVYAKSLLDLAESHGGRPTIESILGELEDILELGRSDKQFGEFLSSRVLGHKDRGEAITRIFSGKVHQLTLNFILTLNRKGRLSHLPAIVASFDSLVQHRFGRVEVDVYTAAPMGTDELREITAHLARVLAKDVIVHPYVEGAMIGGVKFRIGDQLVDGSLATRLRKLKDQFENQGSAELRTRIERMFG